MNALFCYQKLKQKNNHIVNDRDFREIQKSESEGDFVPLGSLLIRRLHFSESMPRPPPHKDKKYDRTRFLIQKNFYCILFIEVRKIYKNLCERRCITWKALSSRRKSKKLIGN